MLTSTMPWHIKQLKGMYEKTNKLHFDYPVQRKSGQWDELQQSLWFHSMLSGFPLPAMFLYKTGENYQVIDGKQRLLSTMIPFVSDEYALHAETPPVIDSNTGEETVIAGKKFSELIEDHQQDILNKKMTCQLILEATDEEIIELFNRLNNGTPLTKNQKARPAMGNENSKKLDEIASLEFIKNTASFTKLQRRRQEDELTIIQTEMLVKEDAWKDFKADSVLEYSKALRTKEDVFSGLKEIFDFLQESFETIDEPLRPKKILKKLHIPTLAATAHYAIQNRISAITFGQWVSEFETEVANPESNYRVHTGAGSIKKDKVMCRKATMIESLQEFVVENGVQDSMLDEHEQVESDQVEDGQEQGTEEEKVEA